MSDYTALNPEFGSIDDFKAVVKTIHAKGMKVIIDWVPNHTGADNRWLTQHPDFCKDKMATQPLPMIGTIQRQLDYKTR